MSLVTPAPIRPSDSGLPTGSGDSATLSRPRHWLNQLRYLVPEGRTLPDDVWRGRHQVILGLLWIHAVVIAAAGLFIPGAWPHSIGEGAIVAGLAILAARPRFGRRLRSLLASFGLVTTSAMVVHLSGGYIEAHFHFFVMVVVIALYQDWVPFLAAIAYVVFHHGLVGALAPEAVYNHPDAWESPWKWALVHGAFVLAASVAAVVSWRFNEAARRAVDNILDSVGEGIFGLDLDGRITFANPAAGTLLGRRPADLLGKRVQDVVGVAPAADAVHPLREGRPTRGHWQRRERGTFPVEYFLTPTHDARGRIGAIVSFRDVTGRVQREAEAQQNAATTRLLHAIAVAANEAATPTAAVQTCLDQVCAYIGWPVGHAYLLDASGTLVPSGIWHLDSPARFAVFQELTEQTSFAPGVGLPGQVLATQAPVWVADVTQSPNFPRASSDVEIGVRSGFGFPVLVGSRVAAVLEFYSPEVVEPDPRLLETMVSAGTQLGRVMERDEAREALRQSEERNRLIVDTANDAFISMDSRGRIVEWNRQAERTFGWSRDEALDRLLAETIIPPAFREAHTRGFQRFLATGESKVMGSRLELAALHREGREFPVELTVWPIRVGEEYRFNAFVRDITTQKETERALQQRDEQLRQAQKMEAVGQLAGGIAHDFNNLLTAINGFSEIALRRLAPADSARGPIEETRKAGERAAVLTQQLLAFSRRQMLALEVVDLNTIIADAERMLQRLIGEHIELVAVHRPNLRPVKVDPGQIQQVLLNLAINARDAMPEGGRLTIEAANVELTEAYITRDSSFQPGPYVMLAVSDTGCGMDADTREHIFEPFFTTKEQGKGTGLGLATVYGIVKQSGGYIWVYSEPGRGSTFKVYLPPVDAPVTPDRSPAELAAVPRGTETILLVEDEDQVRALAREVLESSGYTVLTADDPRLALQLVEEHGQAPDLLVTDVIMPGLSGPELARRIAGAYPALPVLFVSGYTDQAIVHHGVLDEGINFLQKPFSPTTLAQRVREVLDSARRASE